jgi:hypothetical protein
MWPLQPEPRTTELEEVEEGLLESEKADEAFISKTDLNVDRRRRGWLRLDWTWILQLAIFACSSTLFIVSRYNGISDAACTRKLFSYCESNSAS